jgi:hypothetical protein
VSLLVVIGGVLVVLGAAAYAGLWRWWTGRGQDRTIMFGGFWIGVGFVLIGLAPLLGTNENGRLVVTAIGGAIVVVGMLGAWWTPLALTPRWFRAQHPSRLNRTGDRRDA